MGLLPLLASGVALFLGQRPTLDQRAAEALIWGVLPMLGVGAFAWAAWQEAHIFKTSRASEGERRQRAHAAVRR